MPEKIISISVDLEGGNDQGRLREPTEVVIQENPNISFSEGSVAEESTTEPERFSGIDRPSESPSHIGENYPDVAETATPTPPKPGVKDSKTQIPKDPNK